MGLPEVADFARNFAVMVRVQGPDPKGLKMRNQAFHHYNSGRTTLSASGMLFMGSDRGERSSGTVFVLTVASVIEPFLSQQYRDNAAQDKAHLIQGAQIDILVEGKSDAEDNDYRLDKESLPWLPAELLGIVDIPQSSTAVQSLIEASCGLMENGWEVGWSLASHSRGPQHIIGNSRGQVENSSFQSQWLVLGTVSSNPSLMGQSATRIALLAFSLKQPMVNLPKLRTSVPKRGDLLLVLGSPFGILSPVHFFDKFLLSLLLHRLYNLNLGNPKLLMVALFELKDCHTGSQVFRLGQLPIPIRPVPSEDLYGWLILGMEGSPVFDEQSQFVGLLTRPLRQKISGIEIQCVPRHVKCVLSIKGDSRDTYRDNQLVIPWEAIAFSCSGLLQDEPLFPRNGINLNNGSQIPSPVEKATTSICMITTDDGSWASGIVLNNKGLVLTNAHLLEPWRFGKTSVNRERNVTKSRMLKTFYNSNQNLPPTNYLTNENTLSRHSSTGISQRGISVRLDFMDSWLWTDASIVYISKGPLDIALLQIEFASDQLCPIVMDFSCPSPGSKAYVIGHGLFGPRCDFLPSVCFGVIAKVIEAKAAWKHGSYEPNMQKHFPAMLETTATVHSGSSGGAVVNSDGRMIGLVTSNAKHGHTTFELQHPMRCFGASVQVLQRSFGLEELDKPNEHLSSVWALMPPMYTKLAPVLPEPSEIPTEDNSKVTKGSRFSKFVAERNKLLKNMAQPSTTSSYSSELMRSKL